MLGSFFARVRDLHVASHSRIVAASAAGALIVAGILIAPSAATAYSDADADFSLTCSQGGFVERVTVTAVLDASDTSPVLEYLDYSGEWQSREMQPSADSPNTWTWGAFGGWIDRKFAYRVFISGDLIAEKAFEMTDCEGSPPSKNLTVTSACVNGESQVTAALDLTLTDGQEATLSPHAFNYGTGDSLALGDERTVVAPGGTQIFTGTLNAGTYNISIGYAISFPGGGFGGSFDSFTKVPDCTPVPPTVELSSKSVQTGSEVEVTAAGFEPGESVEIWLHSTPALLWSGVADAEGVVIQTVTIPADVELGSHQVEARGSASGSAFADLEVTSAATPTPVPTSTPTLSPSVTPTPSSSATATTGPGATATPAPTSTATTAPVTTSAPSTSTSTSTSVASKPKPTLPTTGAEVSAAPLATALLLFILGGFVIARRRLSTRR